MRERLGRPLAGLILAMLPFYLFLGSTRVVVVNGERVRDESFNVLGLALAGIGLAVTLRAVLPGKRGRDVLRQGLAALAVALCVLQIVVSGGVLPKRDLKAMIWPDSALPALAFKKLDDGNRKISEGILAKNDPPQTIRQIVGYKVSAITSANRHIAYAGLCHAGRVRLDLKQIAALPDFLPEDARGEMSRRVEGDRRTLKTADLCIGRNNAYYMGELVDRANRASAMADILIAGYPAQVAGK